MTELEKLEQSVTYCQRYFEFEDAVKVNKENTEYLKTYIHDEQFVRSSFDLRNKILVSLGYSGGVGVAAFALLLVILGFDTELIVVPIIAGLVAMVIMSIFLISLNRYRLTAAEQKQVEVNKGINEQIEILSSRENQLIRQKEDFYKALEKKGCCVIPLEYMSNITQIRDYVKNGEVQTVEEAVDMFEQNLIMQEMSSLMTVSDEDSTPAFDNKERFGDPLEIIKQNKKKNKKSKK